MAPVQAKGVSKLAIGRHVMCRADINEERVVRIFCYPQALKAFDELHGSSHMGGLWPILGGVRIWFTASRAGAGCFLSQVRPYTPTMLDAEGGYLELVVKAYENVTSLPSLSAAPSRT